MEKPRIQLLGLDNIKIDYSIQSRVEMNNDYMREFSESMLRGDIFPPITIFNDGETNWLADGFHRLGAAKNAFINNLRCEIYDGSRRDAVVYSAGANRAFTIPRTHADKTKSIELLLADEVWFTRPASEIGKHVGVGVQHVRKARLEWCDRIGVDVPQETVSTSGRVFPTFHKKSETIYKDGDNYKFKVKGKEYNGGSNLDFTRSRLAHIAGETKKNQRSLSVNSISQFLISKSIINSCVGNHGSGLGQALRTKIAIIIPEYLVGPHDVLMSAARALFNQKKHDPKARAIVLCYDPPPCEALDIAKDMGVEFMTPEEVVQELK